MFRSHSEHHMQILEAVSSRFRNVDNNTFLSNSIFITLFNYSHLVYIFDGRQKSS